MCSSQKCAVFLLLCKLNSLCVLSGVRESVSHTMQPDDPSQTADPPVLLDLPENRSMIPWVNKRAPTRPTHTSSFRRRVCMDFIMRLQLHSTFLKQMPEWYKSQTQFLTPSKQVFSCSESSVHLSISSLSIIRQTCETGRFSLTKVSNIFLSESSVNKLWMKIFVNKVSGEFQLTKAALSP